MTIKSDDEKDDEISEENLVESDTNSEVVGIFSGGG